MNIDPSECPYLSYLVPFRLCWLIVQNMAWQLFRDTALPPVVKGSLFILA